jgi:Ca2+-transporting ATPase
MKSLPKGLSAQEAKRRLQIYGPNQIEDKSKVSPWRIFISQLNSFLIWILIAAAFIAYFVGESLEAIFILVIVLINTVFGFVQEYRASKAIQALKKMVVNDFRVLRDGKEMNVNSKEIVPGDLIILEEGDKIPADGDLIEIVNLEINEASLTGESIPVQKDLKNSDKIKVFMGTIVEKGRGKALISATGMKTRFGRIAAALGEIEDDPTPLQKQLNSLGKNLSLLAVVSCSLIFVLGVLTGKDLINMLLTSISLAVSVVPEGLPAVVTVTLAIGVQRMVRRAAIVRKLAAIEALGSIDVICTDKTGTLTKNEMSVRKVWLSGKAHEIRKRHPGLSDTHFSRLLKIGILCNNATLLFRLDRGHYDILGDKTEGSLLVLGADSGLKIDKFKENGELVEEFSFDSVKKMMSVVWKNLDGKMDLLTKGAPESILAISDKVLWDRKIVEMDEKRKTKIIEAYNLMASEGYRLIGFGYRSVTPARQYQREKLENSLIFVGFVGIADPPRSEVKEAVRVAKEAGVKAVVITGDNELTAASIAREIGLIEAGEDVLTGAQLDKISDEELDKVIEKIRIFARTSPEHKLRIVRAFQKKGAVVAVTGDGVNDAPALKQGNVGVAMGNTGTDVAKESSDMVVTDDNFASIVKAIEEGRVIYDNITKAIRYLIVGNISELLIILGAIFVGLPNPLTPVQILWINLVTDGLPALALAVDPKSPGVMKRKPRNKEKGLTDFVNVKWISAVGSLIAIATLISFYLVLRLSNQDKAQTLAFTFLVIVQIGLVFVVRKDHRWNSNPTLLFTVILTILLQLFILSFAPLHPAFKITSLW